jgi:hypothetical protein
MQALTAYVEQKNKWHALFGKQANYLDLNKPADRQRVANMIDSELSPENLTCDGELSAAQVRARHKQLITVAKELMKLDSSVKFYEFA